MGGSLFNSGWLVGMHVYLFVFIFWPVIQDTIYWTYSLTLLIKKKSIINNLTILFSMRTTQFSTTKIPLHLSHIHKTKIPSFYEAWQDGLICCTQMERGGGTCFFVFILTTERKRKTLMIFCQTWLENGVQSSPKVVALFKIEKHMQQALWERQVLVGNTNG